MEAGEQLKHIAKGDSKTPKKGKYNEANIEAVSGVVSLAVTLSASDSLATNGVWRTPLATQVTIGNMAQEVSADWSDNSAGVWTYAPTGGTITYARVNTDDYTVTVAY